MKNVLDPIIQQQLDTIQKQGLRANETELNLEENFDLYSGLYENGLSKEELARRIIDQQSINDSKDYFSDPEQIQKANSYANYIIKNQAAQEQIKLTQHIQDMEKRKSEIRAGETIKMEELQNMLQDKPENAEGNAELIVEQAKTRLKQTIDRYTNKIKTMNEANGTEKEALKKEIEAIKAEIKTDKEKYEQVKKDFFASTNYNVENFTAEDLKKVPTKRVRYATRENKLFNAPRITKMKTIRRNMTIKKLINKVNKIGDKPKDGVRFVMGFEKERFLRYTGIKINTAFDKAGSAMGMQMNPQEFHTMFNAGRNNIFAILDAETGDEKTKGEKDMIAALKKRINYYGYAYARERANARVAPFVEAEKNAKADERILETKTIQMRQPTRKAAA